MGRVATDGFQTGGNGVFLVVNLEIPVLGAVLLNFPTDSAFGLIANKQYIRARILDQVFKILNDATTTAHPTRRDYNSRAPGVFQIVDGEQMFLRKLLKVEGMTTPLLSALGFEDPYQFEFRQRLTIKYDRPVAV